MTRDTMAQVAKYWNDIAEKFDAIYTGEKSAFARALDRWLRQDIFGRFDWVMRKAGNARDLTVCDIGCGRADAGPLPALPLQFMHGWFETDHGEHELQ